MFARVAVGGVQKKRRPLYFWSRRVQAGRINSVYGKIWGFGPHLEFNPVLLFSRFYDWWDIFLMPRTISQLYKPNRSLQIWVTSQWCRPLSQAADRRREEDGGGRRHLSCGNKDLKWVLLVSGAGKQSSQNKWEVNTQPQEAINCSGPQLGPSRCPWLGLLRSSITSVWQSPPPRPRQSRGNNGAVSFAQQFVA